MLVAGGNALDAAVAAAFAAFVCELPLCSPLGGGVMLLDRAGEPPRAVDMFARAPGLGGARPSCLDFDAIEVSFGAASQVFHVGRASAALPLAMTGLFEAHAQWGSLPLADVAAPAIRLAREGYELSAAVAFVFDVLTPIVRRSPECLALFSDGTTIAEAGARLRNAALASTLEELAKRPERIRDLLAELAREMGPANGGLLTDEDIARARVSYSDPIRVDHAGWELATMPGPSTGGVLIALGLRLLEGVGRVPFLSREHLLHFARVQEALLSERDERFDERCRDPREIAVLLDEARIARLRDRLAPAGSPGLPDNPLGSTTHISVIDAGGTAVSLTLTNGEGCGCVLPGTGMVVNNLLGEADLHPHGFHRDVPGRALTTMTAPTVLRRGADRIALGSGGSNRLRNAILQVVDGLLEHRVGPEAAVVAPRLHLEREAAALRLAFESDGLDAAVVRALVDAYPSAPCVFAAPNLYFGGVHVALREAGVFGGIGDPRRGGAAVVV
jgi:gamma-glutamyltranspeptidase/glutathione hydrolase